MAALGVTAATDLANALLPLHTRGEALAQTTVDKPFLRWWNDNKKTFPGGKDTITDPVQGAFMFDTAGFGAGYSNDDSLSFASASNILRTSYTWREHHAGLWINWSELKADGITIVDHQKEQQHGEKELFVLTEVLTNRMNDYMESWARYKNALFFQDGSADAKAMAGLKSILTDTTDVGTTGGLNRATYSWWRHRMNTNLAASPENQSICRFFQNELRQLRKFGGRPDVAFCGSEFLTALEEEVYNKGTLTMTGFQNKGQTKFGMADISLLGLGTFTWDPLLDDQGEGKRCYVLDSRRIKLRPMEDEDDKVLTPERPYNYMVFLKSMTWTGTMTATQLNCHGIYAIA